MLIGYARTSTVDQSAGLEAQLRDLKSAGCEKVFSEQISSVAPRKQLEAALEFAREGDTLAVTKIDRLARSMRDLLEIIARLKRKGAALHILEMKLETGSATGMLMMQVFGAVAEFERTMMLERQREGIAKARAEGRYKGRAPTAMRQAPAVLELYRGGKGPSVIARELGIARSSVYKILESEAAR